MVDFNLAKILANKDALSLLKVYILISMSLFITSSVIFFIVEKDYIKNIRKYIFLNTLNFSVSMLYILVDAYLLGVFYTNGYIALTYSALTYILVPKLIWSIILLLIAIGIFEYKYKTWSPVDLNNSLTLDLISLFKKF